MKALPIPHTSLLCRILRSKPQISSAADLDH